MLKKSIGLLVAFVLLMVPIGSIAQNGSTFNIITNGGFETGDATGWLSFYDATISTTSVEAHNGNYAAVMSDRTSGHDGPYQNVTLWGGRTYKFSMWIKADSGTNKFVWMGESDTLMWPHLTNAGSAAIDRWTQFSGEYKVGGVGRITVPLRVMELDATGWNVASAVTDTVYYDDFSIEPIYQATTVEVFGPNVIGVPQSGNTISLLSATVKNQFGNLAEIPQTVTWSLKTPVAGVSVNAETGELSVTSATVATAVTVVATSIDHGNVTGEKNIAVQNIAGQAVVGSISISGNDAIMVPITGENTLAFSAAVNNQEGSTQGMTQDVSWEIHPFRQGISISDTGVLTVVAGAESGMIEVIARSKVYYSEYVGRKTIAVASGMDLAQLAADKITAGSLTTQSLNAITGNLTFDTSGEYGTTITWYSDKTDVVSNTGVVTRTNKNEEVCLTAVVAFGNEKVEKTINLCVLAENPNAATKYAQQNIIIDPGFEVTASEGFFRAYEKSYNNPKSGVACARLTNTEYSSVDTKNFTVLNNVPYRYSAWIRLPDGAASQSVGIAESKSWRWLAEKVISGANGWTLFEGEYTAAGDVGGASTFSLAFIVPSSTANYYVDDISICRISDEAGVKIYTGGESQSTSYDDGTAILTASELKGNLAINKLLWVDTAKPVTMVTAVYDANNKLMNCSTTETDLKAGEFNNIYGVIACTNSASQIKVMLLENLTNLKPLSISESFLVQP